MKIHNIALIFCLLSAPAFMQAQTPTPSAPTPQTENNNPNPLKTSYLKLRALLRTTTPTTETWDNAERIISDTQATDAGKADPRAIVAMYLLEVNALKFHDEKERLATLRQKLLNDPNFQGVVERIQAYQHLSSQPIDLSFTAVDGTAIDLKRLRGKVVLLDFWATWCGPCCREIPHVLEAYTKYHAQGFEVIGISLDSDKDKLLQYTKAQGMVWPQYFDGKGWHNAIAQEFGIQSIPAMWLIDKQGNLYTQNGREDLAGQVEKLLAR